ncbi:MAG: hypothetical protein WCX88_04120 [Patescibacteria group bacterium]
MEPSTAITVLMDDCVIADAYIGPISAEPFYPYIQQVSDVDSTADIGTHSNFTAQQYGPDLINDTLTEADTDTGTSTLGDTSGAGTSYRTVAAGEFRGAVVTAATTGEVADVKFYGRGASTVNVKAVITDSSGVLLTNGVGNAVSVSTTAGTKTLTYTAGSRPKVVAGQTYWIGLVPAANLRLYYDATTGGSMKRDTTNDYTTPTNPSDAGDTTETWRILYIDINELNYELQIEEQFTEIPTNYTNRELAIYTGPNSTAENLVVQGWNVGNTTWTTITTLTPNQWNNVSIASWIDSKNTTFYIRFIGSIETNDAYSSTWQLDTVLLMFYNSSIELQDLTFPLAQYITPVSTVSRGITIAKNSLAQINLDSTLNLNKANIFLLPETATLQDAAVRGISMQFSLTALNTIIDSNTLLKELAKLSTEQLQVVSSLSALNSYLKLSSDTSGIIPILNSNTALLFTSSGSIAIIDNSGLLKALQTGNVESISITDLVDSGKALVVTNTGALGIIDLSALAKAIGISQTELTHILSSTQRNIEMQQFLLGGLTVVDTNSLAKALGISLTDLIQLLSTIQGNRAIQQTLTDDLAIVDTSVLYKALGFTQTSTLTISDINALYKELGIIATANMNIIDVNDLAKALGKSPSELLQILGSTQKNMGLQQQLIDTLTIQSIIATLKELTAGIEVSFGYSENATAQDILTVIKAMEKTGSESIGIVPLGDAAKSIIVLPDGSLYLVDTATFLKAMGITLAENQTLTDLLLQLKALQQNGVETIRIIPTVDGVKALIIMPDGTIQLVDAAALYKALLFSNSDTTIIADSSTLNKALKASLIEILSPSDLFNLLKSQQLHLTVSLSSTQDIQDLLSTLKSLQFGNDEAIKIIPLLDSNRAILIFADGSILLVDFPNFLKALGITLPSSLAASSSSTMNKGLWLSITEWFASASLRVQGKLGIIQNVLIDLSEDNLVAVGAIVAIMACSVTGSLFVVQRRKRDYNTDYY